MALARRRSASGRDAWPERPEGALLWAHATSTGRMSAICEISGRLKAQRPELSVLLTVDPGVSPHAAADDRGCDWVFPVPAEGQGAAQRFVEHWRPDLGLWTGGHLRPALIQGVGAAGVPLVLLDAAAEGFPGRRPGWLPDPMRGALQRFSRVLACDAAAAETLRRLGLAPDRIEVTGRLQIVPNPPPCDEDEVAEVAGTLSGRPVWLAVSVHPDEAGTVLGAHRFAMRYAHRLLLVVFPDGEAGHGRITALLDEMKLRHRVWRMGEAIEDIVQVLVVPDPAEMGLWYRLSPQAFMGNSLVTGGRCRSPIEAAALGSAVLHGPHVGLHAPAYVRLNKAGAARRVTDAETLGDEVRRLVAPDRAAEMALAGWDVATEGAGLTARLMTMIERYLDGESDAGGPDAGS